MADVSNYPTHKQTYDPIAVASLTTPSTITFSNIPSNYSSIRIQIVGGTTRASTSDTLKIRFNSDTGSNYSRTYLLGNGSTASSSRGSNETFLFGEGIRMSGTTNGLSSQVGIDILSYSSTSVYKTVLATSEEPTTFGTTTAVGLWRSTSAITSISLEGDTVANFAAGTVASLYGIAG